MGGGEGRRVPSLLILGGTFPSPCNRFLILQMYCCTKTFWHWAVNFLWPGHCFLTHDFKDSKLLKRIWWQTKHGLWINIFTFDWETNQTKEKVYLIPSYCFSVNLISVKRRLIGSRGVRPLQLFREKQTKKVEKWEVTDHRPVYPFQREAASLIWFDKHWKKNRKPPTQIFEHYANTKEEIDCWWSNTSFWSNCFSATTVHLSWLAAGNTHPSDPPVSITR